MTPRFQFSVSNSRTGLRTAQHPAVGATASCLQKRAGKRLYKIRNLRAGAAGIRNKITKLLRLALLPAPSIPRTR
jgi:hypothetical protein